MKNYTSFRQDCPWSNDMRKIEELVDATSYAMDFSKKNKCMCTRTIVFLTQHVYELDSLRSSMEMNQCMFTKKC
jgi:hypothetical protein